MKVNQKQLNSLAVSLLLSTDALCYTLPALGIGTFYRVMYLVETGALLIVLIGFIIRKQWKISMAHRQFSIAYFLWICFIYATSCFRVPNYSYALDSFIYCFAIGVFIIGLNFDTRTVLTLMTVMSVLILPAYSRLFAYQWESLNQANMGTVYAILIWTVAGLCHFIYYRDSWGKVCHLFYVPSIVGLFGIIQFANRGAALSLITFLLVVAFNRNVTLEEFKGGDILKKKIAIVIAAIIGYIVILNFNSLFMCLYNFLNGILDNMPSFFVKMNKMIALNDISNGREPVYEAAFAGIRNNPIFGNGIESFPSYTAYSYPHNFVLQLIYEGGILFCVVPIITILWVCYRLFFSQIQNKDKLVFLILLFVQVIPRFLVSATIWKDRCLWLMIFYVFYNYKEIGDGINGSYQGSGIK